MNTVILWIALRSLLACQARRIVVSRTQSSRVYNLQGHIAHTGSPIHLACGDSDNEKEIAETLQSKARASIESGGERNPFAICKPLHPEVEVEQLAAVRLKLCALGKLAKNGNFFASEDGVVLAKRVDTLEVNELKVWGDLAVSWSNPAAGDSAYPGGCPAFSQTLLTPITTAFTHSGYPYLVMPNLTHSLAQAAPNDWVIKAVFDAKPLPNLGKGLVKLVKRLLEDQDSARPKMKQWQGWDEVRSILATDLKFLKDRVVDYSLFVHVLERETSGPANETFPVELSPSKGCVLEPSKLTMFCFRILDYLTPYTWTRGLESQFKASKFEAYTKKFLGAFDCIGDIYSGDCTTYKALASITEAMDVSKAMAKAVFIGLKGFPAAYTCTYEAPFLRYRAIFKKMHGQGGSTTHLGQVLATIGDEYVGDGRLSERGVGIDVAWDDRTGEDVVKWLQSIASAEAGTRYIKDFCEEHASALECTKAALDFAIHENRDERLAGANYLDLDQCAKMVNSFATESYTSGGDENADMHNVLWSPAQSQLIAVRGLPKIPIVNFSMYYHKAALARGRERMCFLKMRYLRCTPEDNQGVYFNYKQHFGDLEVMVLFGRDYSQDLNAFAEHRSRGVRMSRRDQLWRV